MRIEVLSYDEHTRRRKVESAVNQRNHTDERWSEARLALLDRLGVHWTVEPTEYGGGDFFIGEDWSGNSALHVVIMKWEVLTTDFLQECHKFLLPHDPFLITIGKSMPEVEDMSELVVTKQRAYIAFFETTRAEAKAVVSNSQHYAAVAAFLN